MRLLRFGSGRAPIGVQLTFGFSRAPREDSVAVWIYVRRGSAAATWCYASFSRAHQRFAAVQLTLALLEQEQPVLPWWCFQNPLQFPRPLLRHSVIRSTQALDE